MIRRLHNLSIPRHHPRASLLSRYLDDDLDARARQTLEAHVQGCPRCRQELAALASTVRALGLLETEHPSSVTESVIAALRADAPREVQTSKASTRAPALTLVPGSARASVANRIRDRWPQIARSALGWCVQRSQLRVTLPIGLVAGVVLSLVNMGGMLMHGRIDLGVCVSCAVDFLVPFLAVNLILLMLLWAPRRRRVPPA